MPRTKNYEASDIRVAQVAGRPAQPKRPALSASDACIDMKALLGPHARFAGTKRILDHRSWLGRGIDHWVCTTGFCLRAMLLSGARTTRSVTTYWTNARYLFEYLAGDAQTPAAPKAKTPQDLSPLHVQHFIGWLKNRAQAEGWMPSSTRSAYKCVKALLVEMFVQGFIEGESSRFFPRGAVTWRSAQSRQTSLSDAEQERLAEAIKSDLSKVHHGRLTLTQSAVQGLRLLVVAHRQGLNPTPLLEMRRDALAPGFLPGTIRIRTSKYRNKKNHSSIGRAAPGGDVKERLKVQPDEEDLFFDLSEGAVLQQAIASTRHLVDAAPAAIKQRIWLYCARAKTGAIQKGSVTCLSGTSLSESIAGVIRRHGLLGDDGKPLQVNLSRLRKSRFDRALRVADGDMAITANLMGNTPQVAGANYPSMNDARKAEAAGFMNVDYIASMRQNGPPSKRLELRTVPVHPYKVPENLASSALPTPSAISSCQDSINGQHAPKDGRHNCDRYVMCLFCSSFAIVGEVDELWRLFSFQAFARAELDYLDKELGEKRTADELLEDLRDRYRIAIPYIDDFTQRQFVTTRVIEARARTAAELHPYWEYQKATSRRARRPDLAREQHVNDLRDDTEMGNSVGS